MTSRVVINQPAVTKFVQTDRNLQGFMNIVAQDIEDHVVDNTPVGTGMWHGKQMNKPGLARRRVEMVKYRWWRRIRSRELAGHIIEFGSPEGTDSIGRHHYRTPEYRPFTRAALNASVGRFVPRSKGP